MGWGTLLNGIMAGDEAAGTTLYRELMPIRSFFAAQLSTVECEDRYHDVIVAVLRAIRLGGLRDPEAIPAYAWSTAQRIRRMRLSVIISQRESTTEVDSETLSDAAPDPESIAIRQQNKEVATRVLAALPERHREVLMRYYLKRRGACGDSVCNGAYSEPVQGRQVAGESRSDRAAPAEARNGSPDGC